MYLSRMVLDVQNRRTMQAFVNPNLFHGAVESAFCGERKRNLWRIDTLNGQYYLLLLSEEKPDLSDAVKQFGYADTSPAWQTKAYEMLLDRITDESIWQFRLTANPTKACKSSTSDSRGKVHAHVSVQHQKNWLLQRAERCGFSLSEEDFTVVHTRWYQFRKGNSNHMVSLLSVTYEGILTVTDKERFRKTLIEGIGREKAYGMGLLTVVGGMKANE